MTTLMDIAQVIPEEQPEMLTPEQEAELLTEEILANETYLEEPVG